MAARFYDEYGDFVAVEVGLIRFPSSEREETVTSVLFLLDIIGFSSSSTEGRTAVFSGDSASFEVAMSYDEFKELVGLHTYSDEPLDLPE